MSKAAVRTRRAEQVQRMRMEEARRERNRRLLIAGSTVAIVLVIIAAFVIARLLSNPADSSNTAGTGTAASSVARDVTSVPAGTLDKVGVGTANNHPVPISGAPPLTADGRPEVLYVGAEYCPYCAATRWGIVVALSRFGTFTGLGQTTSSSTDYAPNTPTLTFHGAKFTSKYVTFHAYETQDRTGKPLDSLTGADKTTFATYDAPPYVPADSAGTIPWIDIGGKYLQSGSAFDPMLLQGKTHQQIAASLKDPSNPISQAVNGDANSITAAICAVTHQQPAAVCKTPGVQAAAKNLASSSQGAGSSGQ